MRISHVTSPANKLGYSYRPEGPKRWPQNKSSNIQELAPNLVSEGYPILLGLRTSTGTFFLFLL